MEQAAIFGFIVGVVGAAAALIQAAISALRARSDARVAYRTEAQQERSARLEAEAKVEKLEDSLKALRLELGDLRESEDRLEKLGPLAAVEGVLQDWDSVGREIAWVLDFAQCLFVITSPDDGGHFLWVNSRWQELLGWPPERLLGHEWASLLHPDDRGETRRAETHARVGRVDDLVNRFRCADGRYALLRWRAPSYRKRLTLAVARVEGYE